jgi:hypothetical protein
MAYLNFNVDVSALPNGQYRVTVQSPIGQASADLNPPFTPDELEAPMAVFNRTRRVSPQLEQQIAIQFGSRLFDFLIRGSSDINAAYLTSLDRAAGTDGLRIRLSVDRAGDLRLIPWEFLRDPARDFLALSRSTPIVRYSQGLSVRPAEPIMLPLRVLVVISSPADHAKLDVEGEWTRLQEATAELRANGLLEIERLEQATLIALQRRLRREVFHVVHYVGHSDYDEMEGQGYLVFEHETDPTRSQIVSGAALGRELGEESTIRLIVLNSCQSGHPSERDWLAGITSNLVARGMPAVVAMQFAITDGSAKAFSEEFYRAISEFLPIDTAVSEGRRAIANRRHNAEWATPVLYMRSDDGTLFEQKPASENTTQPPDPLPDHTRVQSRTVNPILGVLVALVVLVVAGILLLRPQPEPLVTPDPPTPTTPPELRPDLRIGTVRVAPSRPGPGQIFRVSVAITNVGSVDSGPFNWTWDASLAPPVQQNSQVGRVENIPPGATRNISFPFSYGWWGRYSSLLVADIDSEVDEIDERNNRLPFDIEIADLPFDIDFTLLPNNEVAAPPVRFISGGDEFVPWNMIVSVNPLDRPECAEVPLLIAELDGDIVLTLDTEGFPAVCADLPISIVLPRRVIGDALVELVGGQAGEALVTFYGDSAGTNTLFTSGLLPIQAGETLAITPDEGFGGGIRRIDVQMPGQPVNLTRLVLSLSAMG